MPALFIVLLMGWSLGIAALGLRYSGVLVRPIGASEVLSLPARMTWATLGLTGGTVLLAFLTLLIRPSWLLRVLSGASLVVLVAVAIVTGSSVALVTACSITCLAFAAGHLLLCLVHSAPRNGLSRSALDLALGFALIGLLWFLLGAVGLLASIPTVLATLALFTALAALVRRWGSFEPALPRPETTSRWGFAAGLSLACIWGIVLFALLGAFVPESQSDAIKQHLPIAREFWQAHQIHYIETMPVTSQSIQQHVLFAVAFGFGGPIAPQLLQAVFGVSAIISVAALAWELGGRTAAICAAAIFGVAPIVLWELGHSFIDVLPVLFTAGAALCLLHWQTTNGPVWLLLAGALGGIGITTKLTVTAIVVAMALAIMLVGRAPWRWQERLGAVGLFGVGTLTILPWFIVNTTMTGRIYGLDPLLSRLHNIVASAGAAAATPAQAPGTTSSLAQVAEQDPARHGLRDFLAMPWLLTFGGESFAYPIIGRGELGIAPLVLAPFTLLLPRRRSTALLLVIVTVSFVLWWLTPLQNLRHLLPCFAIAAALLGAGAAPLLNGWRHVPATRRLAALTLAGCLVAALAVSPLFFLARPRATIPVDYLIGREDRATVLANSIRTASVVQMLDSYVSAETPVAYLGRVADAPQIYTEAKLEYLPLNSAGSTLGETLETLERKGIRYVIWERSSGPVNDSSAVIRSTPFLREHARILAGADNAYLFEILPAGATTWGETQVTNLLEDPDFGNLKGKKSAWSVDGHPDIAKGSITLTRKSSLTQETPVTPETAYLLEVPVGCSEENSRAVFSFRWLDAAGAELANASEAVAPGIAASDQFLWRRAPAGAATLQSTLSMSGPGRCEFSGASLYALP